MTTSKLYDQMGEPRGDFCEGRVTASLIFKYVVSVLDRQRCLPIRQQRCARVQSSGYQHIPGDPERHRQHRHHSIGCVHHRFTPFRLCPPVRYVASDRHSGEIVIQLRLQRSSDGRHRTIDRGLMFIALAM
jgi:hypothetical protein